MITLEKISKTYKVPIRKGGMKAAIQGFFKREYKEIDALKEISFHINEGEIVGYIGPNGAGKSTTIKIMSGILYPDKGTCLIHGINPFQNRKKHAQNIGVVFGQRSQLWWDIPIIDSFDLLKDIYKISETDYKKRLKEYTQEFQLEEILMMPARQLSLGQRMKCELIAALLHSPKVLFLDEPTIGLDAISKVTLRNIIKDINQKYHTTIVLTTHDMQDIVSLATRIMLIGEGSILFDGDLETLKKIHPVNDNLEISYEGDNFDLGDIKVISHENHKLCIEVDRDFNDLLTLLSSRLKITSIETSPMPIDALMVHIYKDLNL